MLSFQSVPTTCTANMITNWSDVEWVDPTTIPTKNAKIQMVKRAQEHLNTIKNTGYKLDFDCLFAIVTHTQYVKCKTFMEMIGLKEVYEGNKGVKGTSRHVETGHLHMFVAHPTEIKAATEAFLKMCKDLLDELDPPMVADPDRQAYPDMILKNFYGHGLIKKAAEDVHRVRSGIRNGELDKFKALLSMKFGTDFSDEDAKFLSVPLEEASFGMLLAAQKRWKEDKIILLSDLKKRKTK